jgi:hypothetical protein
MSKLTHFAHPKGWEKGEPVGGTEMAGKAAVAPLREMPAGVVRYVSFVSEARRDQWLKWWRKP